MKGKGGDSKSRSATIYAKIRGPNVRRVVVVCSIKVLRGRTLN